MALCSIAYGHSGRCRGYLRGQNDGFEASYVRVWMDDSLSPRRMGVSANRKKIWRIHRKMDRVAKEEAIQTSESR